jgi:hypothetical protein
MRRKVFQDIIDSKIAELEQWKNNPDSYHTKLVGYVLDIDDKTETIHVDMTIIPAEPIPYITLNFTPDVSFDEVIKKEPK